MDFARAPVLVAAAPGGAVTWHLVRFPRTHTLWPNEPNLAAFPRRAIVLAVAHARVDGV